MRLNNNAEANRKASEIDSRVLREINALKPEKKPEATGYIIGGVLLGWVIGAFTGGLIGFVVGFLIPLGMWGAACGKVNDTNANIERRMKEIQAKGNADKKKAQKEADMKTQKEAAAYDTEVRKYCDCAMAKADLFTPMIDHQEMMFQRMISHADHGSNMAFVEADLVYTVTNTGITYTYHDSRYSNSMRRIIDQQIDSDRIRIRIDCQKRAAGLKGLKQKYLLSGDPKKLILDALQEVQRNRKLFYRYSYYFNERLGTMNLYKM